MEPLDAVDLHRLAHARSLLEKPGLAIRLSGLVGRPVDGGLAMLPPPLRRQLAALTRQALVRAVDTAAGTLEQGRRTASPRLHKLLGSLSGGAGGAFGLAGLTIEIPLSTVLIMRSILDVARAEGEDTTSDATRVAALEVFAFGGTSRSDDAAESGYYAMRAVLARAVSDATNHLARHGLVHEGAPAILRLVEHVAARYGMQLTHKVAAMTVPGIGAAAGAAINLLFMDHYQAISKGHFTIRGLERRYGADAVRRAWRIHSRGFGRV